MKNILTVLLLIFFLSCKTEKKNVKSTQNQNSHKKDISISNNESQVKKINKSLLNGIWAENIDENALFFIENDSIYYLDNQDIPFYIEFKDDSFSVHYDNFISNVKIKKLDNDSLVYKSDSGITRLCRIIE